MRTGASGPLQFNPLDLAQEAWKFQQHLAEGMRTLGQLPPDVHYGATEREEVWRDGKTVLYRFVGDKPATGPALLIVYAQVVEDPAQFDALLVDALAARLAADIAYSLVGSQQAQAQAWDVYRAKLAEARQIDAQEQGVVDEFSAPDWIESRL